jgi:hypothetical protein
VVEWLKSEVRRVYAILGESEEDRAPRQLSAWIKRRGGVVSVRDLTHNLRQYRGQPDLAQAHLDALATAGCGAWEHPAPGPKGGRPSPRFVLATDNANTKTPADAAANDGIGCGDAPSGAGDAEEPGGNRAGGQDGDSPTVSLAAGSSKRRRADVQPVSANLAAALRSWLRGRPLDAPCWPGRWNERAAAMIRADLRRARAHWILATPNRRERRKRLDSEFLVVADGAGRVADFHALRVTYITLLVKAGASTKVCQALARHSTPVLTLNTYARLGVHDLGSALDGLPDLSPTTRSPGGCARRAQMFGICCPPVIPTVTALDHAIRCHVVHRVPAVSKKP